MKLLLILIIIFCSLCLVEAQSNPHYTVTDPAIKEMLISMDMPRYTGNVPAENIVGAWQLILSDGTYIDLALLNLVRLSLEKEK